MFLKTGNMCKIKCPSLKEVKVKGKSMFKWLLSIGSLLVVSTGLVYAEVPVGAPQAFVSSVVQGAGTSAGPTTAPEAAAAPAGAPAATGKGAKPSPFLFATAPYFGLSIGPRSNFNGVPALYRALEGTISLGVEAMLTTRLYLGGEVFFGNSLQIHNYKNKSNVKTNWTYGFDIIPGFLVNSFVLGYLRIGVSSSHFLGQGSSSTAWRLGFGGETNFYCKKWYIRGEYIYNSYNAMSHVGRVRANQINLGVVYKFL